MIEFDVIAQHKLVWFRGEGHVSHEELIGKIVEVNRHPEFQPDFNTFVDFGDAEVLFIQDGFSQYQEFFGRHQQTAAKRRWGIYSRKPETFKSAAMAHFGVDDTIAVRVFEAREAVLAWLGIPDPAGLAQGR